jgi:DNA-binding NtrC family response regulator
MLNTPTSANAGLPTEPRPTVMVVEDEQIIREFVCEILQFEGFDTVEYGTADDAWKAFGEGVDIKLLITDIRMPGDMDGAQLTERVHTQWPKLPIIVMSGHETPETVNIANDVAFLPKPWTIGKLTDEVMRAVYQEELDSAR